MDLLDRARRVIDIENAARAGACLVIAPDGGLGGIFTYGDFARAFQRNQAIGNQPVDAFMTVDPISVPADALAAEALKTIGTHRVDDIVVLDADKCPVGLIDTQDLARLKIV